MRPSCDPDGAPTTAEATRQARDAAALDGDPGAGLGAGGDLDGDSIPELIVGNAGVLLTRVVRVKPGVRAPWLIVDAGMNDLMRPALCAEALRLGRLLVGLAPTEPEASGLLALMELQASRAAARTGPGGEPVLLQDQDRTRWDRDGIGRGLRALLQAERPGVVPGPYTLQAAIAACHARAEDVASTDWGRIVALYDLLARAMPSPVVALNRAVAVSMHTGPGDALALVDALADEPALRAYHLLPAVRGDLLHKLGRCAEARTEFMRAAEMTRNARERSLLLARADAARE